MPAATAIEECQRNDERHSGQDAGGASEFALEQQCNIHGAAPIKGWIVKG